MNTALGANNYGKARVRFAKVIRRGDKHEFRELRLNVALRGDFESAHTQGDNSKVVPTDTMKNTIFALGQGHDLASIEAFALDLARHFVSAHESVSEARVEIAEVGWDRLDQEPAIHPHTFLRRSPMETTCTASVGSDGESVKSGLCGLVILKTTDSAFSGYIKDRFTTLRETRDRIMGTSVTAQWTRAGEIAGGNSERRAIVEALIGTFADHQSESVQHTLYAMGQAALDAASKVREIRLSLPNLHYLPVDVGALGLDDERSVFLPIDEPHGLIEATIVREV